MKQIKPVVIGYNQIEFLGVALHVEEVLTKNKMIEVAKDDRSTQIHSHFKSIFRPVYDYTVNHEVES